MDEALNVKSFLYEVWDDFKSPSTSAFVTRLQSLKSGVGAVDQLLEADHSGLTRLKKSIKAAVSSGNSYVENEVLLAESLDQMCSLACLSGDGSSADEDIGNAFHKFAVVSRDLSSLMKNLISSLGAIVLHPLDHFLKNDLKDAAGDLRKSFEKSWKECDSRFHKIEREKIRLAEAAGLYRSHVTGPEVAEEMDKEKKQLQLHATEYLIKVNEIKTRKNVELLNHLVDFYQAQTSFFQDGLKTINHFNSYVKGLVPQLTERRHEQERERRELTDLRDTLRSSLSCYREASARPSSASSQAAANRKEAGTEKAGYLLKKSEGKIKKMWQKRKCIIHNGVMLINHSSESKPPVRLNLLTCSAKLVVDDPSKKCFDLLSSSNNRTYHFQAEDEKEFYEWIAVINNAKEEQLMKVFSDSSTADSINQNMKELTSRIIAYVKTMPGNSTCCDCCAPGPEWLSTNFGVLICLECCGVHREMGVHVSRTQSIVIDHLCTSQLLIARKMGNQAFNEIMEATLSDHAAKSRLILPTSPRDERNAFIRAKYENRKFAIKTCSNSNDLITDLMQAVDEQELSAMLQVYAEGLDLMTLLPATEVTLPGGTAETIEETALHRAVRLEDGTSLHIIDFLVQNATGNRLETKDSLGCTVLHACALYNRSESMKLVLKARPSLALLRNAAGKTPLDVARDSGYKFCAELIQHAANGKTSLFENVNFDWAFADDDFNDFSDDDLDSSIGLQPDTVSLRSGLAAPSSFLLSTDQRERRRASDAFDLSSASRDKHRRGGSSGADLVEDPSVSGSIATNISSASSEDQLSLPTAAAARRKPTGDSTPALEQASVSTSAAPSVAAAASPPAKQPAITAAGVPAVHMGRTASAAAATSASSIAAALRERRKTVDSVQLSMPPPTVPTKQLQPTASSAAAVQAAQAKAKSLTPREGKMIEAAISKAGNGLIAAKGSSFQPHHSRASSDSSRGLALALPPQPLLASPLVPPAQAAGSDDLSPSSSQLAPPPLPEKKHRQAGGPSLVPPPPQFVGAGEKMGRADDVSINAESWSSSLGSTLADDRSQKVSLQSVQRRSSFASTATGPGTSSKPLPPPRPLQVNTSALPIRKRCRAAYDCVADAEDELSFYKDEVIVILKSPADSDWWYGEIDGNPKRRGYFPITFVTMLKE